MLLEIPTKLEALSLIGDKPLFRDCEIVSGALPPEFLLKEAVKEDSTHWIMPRLFVLKNDHKVIGSGGFNSEPLNGLVEIGYNVAPYYQQMGYGTLAVYSLIQETLHHDEITTIVAESVVSNFASQKVLQKNGFVVYGKGFDDDEETVKMKLNLHRNTT